ncbi:MAG: SPOR domain-containing protein [Cyclobacteriaceae bacterium]|nr:SPOR domain-containing protein [Cytophagales bacterium]MBX2898911.1 SPOR domain-containing protein [Cyclobacteriaceae bacterium]
MAKRKDTNDSANEQNENAEDSFGLPDIEYKPLETETQSETETDLRHEPVREPYSYVPKTETKSNAPIIIAVVIGLVLIVGAFLIYQYVYKPKAEAERQKKELAAREAQAKREEEARLAREREEEERRRREEAAAAANAKPVDGTIESLSTRTGRYYVVISSAVDGDLVMDYAKKLSAKGVSSKIIPPFGKWKFYRLTISDFDSFAAAQTSADSAKPEFGEGAWVIRY